MGIFVVLGAVVVLWRYPSLREAVNRNQGVVSVVLTAMLVVLYFGQFRLQSRQLQFQHKPHVEIQKYETEGKQLEVWLSNLGNGVATDIELETCIDFEPTDDLEPGCASIRFRRVGENGDPKRRVGNSLKAGEHNIRFVCEPVTKITSDRRAGLMTATRRLAAEGLDEATLGFFVTSKNLLGHEDRERVFGWDETVELESGGMNIEDFRAAPGSIEIEGERTFGV
jgi:hypothetical protein